MTLQMFLKELVLLKRKARIAYSGSPGCNTQEVGEKLTDLKDEIQKLEDHEKLLDTHTQWIQQSIKNIESDLANRKYAYITYDDVKNRFGEELVLGIQAPSDTQLHVPNIAKAIEDEQNINYEIYMKSTSGDIKVYMIQPELAEIYNNKVLEMRLQEEPKGIKREKEEDEKKEESKPKRKVGRPPRGAGKLDPVLSEDEEEEDPELIEAKIILSGVGTSEIVRTDLDLLDEFYTDICGPLVRLSPPPGERDYQFNLSESEGICDLFDIVAK
ncbi:transcription factor E2F4 isoform X2 [Cephus cinctus]|uniref:Transcription factor E2F4 isoform X2 n=1 Tax=Cephus cinctus TaxID=211228 RepID=A0AAJ7RQE2_CEPCN|nr:transcription factor E2F4 isoform X2 [Cephus cinctus]